MGTDLPEPFDRIVRLVGRRSQPHDWPQSYDSWDAYDAEGGFLLTLHYKALSQLLDGAIYAHTIVLEFEDDDLNERTVVVTSSMSMDLKIRLTFGDDHFIDNPDEILSKDEMMQILTDAMTAPVSRALRARAHSCSLKPHQTHPPK